jgi:outer membrane protein insertion porin family
MGRERKLKIIFLLGLLLSFAVSTSIASGDEHKGKWITEVRFEGNKNFPDQMLLDAFLFEDDIAGKVNELFVHPFGPGTAGRLRHKLIDFYRRRGFQRPAIGEPKFEVDGDGLKVTVPIEEGTRSRVGNITVQGTSGTSLTEVRRVLGLEKGQVIDHLRLIKALDEDLPRLFGTRGHAFPSVEIEDVEYRQQSAKEGDMSVDFKVVINEGRRSRIKVINIMGNADASMVRSYFTFKEGEWFNRLKIEDSLTKLNDSGLFRNVDFNGHVFQRTRGDKSDRTRAPKRSRHELARRNG